MWKTLRDKQGHRVLANINYIVDVQVESAGEEIPTYRLVYTMINGNRYYSISTCPDRSTANDFMVLHGVSP